MVVFAGQGDARRSMGLLWRTPPTKQVRRGPKPALSVEQIVRAGIEIADAEGMAALSMRSVGDRLGRTGMALYTYVPSKDELVDLMYDRVMAELPTGYPTADGWRPAVTAWADDLLAFYLRHPWVLQVSQARPVLGPGEFAVLDTLIGVLRATGKEPRVLQGVVSGLFDLVRGSARTIAETRRAPAETGLSDEDWWRSRASVLGEVAPDFATRFPNVTWLETGVQEPPDPAVPYLEREARRAFATTLALFLDGIAHR